jgi:hypothetical protein
MVAKIDALGLPAGAVPPEDQPPLIVDTDRLPELIGHAEASAAGLSTVSPWLVRIASKKARRGQLLSRATAG